MTEYSYSRRGRCLSGTRDDTREETGRLREPLLPTLSTRILIPFLNRTELLCSLIGEQRRTENLCLISGAFLREESSPKRFYAESIPRSIAVSVRSPIERSSSSISFHIYVLLNRVSYRPLQNAIHLPRKQLDTNGAFFSRSFDAAITAYARLSSHGRHRRLVRAWKRGSSARTSPIALPLIFFLIYLRVPYGSANTIRDKDGVTGVVNCVPSQEGENVKRRNVCTLQKRTRGREHVRVCSRVRVRVRERSSAFAEDKSDTRRTIHAFLPM